MTPETCNICGGSLEDGFCRDPKLFGKRPGPICFACFTVPAQPPDWKRGDPKPLHSLDDMMSFGWTKEEAKLHIRAVKKFFKIRTPRASKSGPENGEPEVQETAKLSEVACAGDTAPETLALETPEPCPCPAQKGLQILSTDFAGTVADSLADQPVIPATQLTMPIE